MAKKAKAGKTSKQAKKGSKRRKGVKSVAIPVPRPPDNVIYITDDDQVVVATGTGHVTIVTDEALANQLKGAIQQRQQAALDLTQVLKDNGYDVIAGSTTSHGPHGP